MNQSSPRWQFLSRVVNVFALLGLMLLNAQACSLSAATGKIIDEETGKPLEGVFVMAMWNAGVVNPAISQSTCYHFEITKTDKEGKYKLSTWSGNFNPLYYDRYIAHEYYLPGYTSSSNNIVDSGLWNMKRTKQSIEERLKSFVHNRYTSCTTEKERKKKLVPLLKAQYEEGQKIAVTDEQKELLKSVKLEILYAELGYMEFSKKQLNGDKK